jgi:hypothetical protein
MSKRRHKPLKHIPSRRFEKPWSWIPVVILAVAAVVAARTLHSRRGANESSAPERASTPRSNDALAAAPFLPTVENKTVPPGLTPAGMVWIPGGEFSMGAQDPPDMNDSGRRRPGTPVLYGWHPWEGRSHDRYQSPRIPLRESVHRRLNSKRNARKETGAQFQISLNCPLSVRAR